MATPVQGIGAALSWNSQTVAKLTRIDGVEITLGLTDSTTHQSTGGYDEVVPGRFTTSEIPIEGYFDYGDTNGQLAMITDFGTKTLRAVVITFPSATGTTWSFNAYITKIAIKDPGIDGLIPFSASLKISGQPTFATAASNNMSALTLTTATLFPTFAAGTYDYTATSTGASITVTPTAAAGVITVNGSVVVTTEASAAISLGSSGTMTTVTIIVTEANKSPKTYTIRVAKTA